MCRHALQNHGRDFRRRTRFALERQEPRGVPQGPETAQGPGASAVHEEQLHRNTGKSLIVSAIFVVRDYRQGRREGGQPFFRPLPKKKNFGSRNIFIT